MDKILSHRGLRPATGGKKSKGKKKRLAKLENQNSRAAWGYDEDGHGRPAQPEAAQLAA